MKPDIGVIPALLTPLNEDETIDVPSLENLIEWVLSFDTKALFVAGTMGEGVALRDRERAILFKETVRIVKGRVPVMASVSDNGTKRMLGNVDIAVEAKVDSVVATPRMAFPPRIPGETFRLFEAVAEHSKVPVWFYENPVLTPVTSTFESISEIMALPNVEGLKFSATNFELFARCKRELPGNPPCFNGNVPEIAMSARIGGGAISGIGSMLPALCVRIFDTALAGQDDLAQKYQAAINASYAIYGGEGWPLWPSAQKHVLMRKGIIRTNIATAPFARIGPDEAARIDQALEGIEDWVFNPPAG